MNYFKKLVGPRLYLSPMRAEDAETYVKWLNDSAVTDGLGATARLQTVQDEREWIEKNTGSQFAIVRLSDDTLLGNCGLQAIQQIYQNAEVGIFIGEEENRNQGYGAEALRLLLGFGFETLNLNNMMLKVFSFNERAVACYQKVGFKEFGRRRKSYYCRGAFHDEIYIDILKEEWPVSSNAVGAIR